MAVDATAVPADRGGVGRYVDELLPALAAEGADLVVVCQDHDAAHYAELVPDADLRAAPAAIGPPPGPAAWEQVGLSRLARQGRRRRPALPALHDAAGVAGCPS